MITPQLIVILVLLSLIIILFKKEIYKVVMSFSKAVELKVFAVIHMMPVTNVTVVQWAVGLT